MVLNENRAKKILTDLEERIKKDVQEKYGVKLTKFRAGGISAMMHGYLAFDKEENLSKYHNKVL